MAGGTGRRSRTVPDRSSDLLHVAESSQLAPSQGAACEGLAKKVILVGDSAMNVRR